MKQQNINKIKSDIKATNNVCNKKCDPFFIKTDIHGYCKQCNKYLGYVRK